jgi:hypothetical protein
MLKAGWGGLLEATRDRKVMQALKAMKADQDIQGLKLTP